MEEYYCFTIRLDDAYLLDKVPFSRDQVPDSSRFSRTQPTYRYMYFWRYSHFRPVVTWLPTGKTPYFHLRLQCHAVGWATTNQVLSKCAIPNDAGWNGSKAYTLAGNDAKGTERYHTNLSVLNREKVDYPRTER